MSKSIYERKQELYKLWKDLKECMNDDSLSFDKFMEIKEHEEKAYYHWVFYNNFTKACNKLKREVNNENRYNCKNTRKVKI